MSDHLTLELEYPVAALVLNRPQRRNALNRAMWQAIPGLLARAAEDPEVKLLLVRGATAAAFASGADISEFFAVHADRDTSRAYNREVQTAVDALYRFPKPTVAVVQGPCVGGGTSLALACDVRFADESAVFGVPPARLGLVYTLEDTLRLARAVGAARARDMIYTARLVPAAEAHGMGLVQYLCASAELASRVAGYTAAICSLSQYTICAAKQALLAIEGGQVRDDADTLQRFEDAFFGPDFTEGTQAFLDRRAARFAWRRRN